jgi:hypothetical protein
VGRRGAVLPIEIIAIKDMQFMLGQVKLGMEAQIDAQACRASFLGTQAKEIDSAGRHGLCRTKASSQ